MHHITATSQAEPAAPVPPVVIVRMPRRGGGTAYRLATVLATYPPIKQVRVEFCSDGQRALVAPQSIACHLTPEVCHG